MYYPLLRARQFELIALRELATEQATQENIRPIIEPVKRNHNNLNLAHKVFNEKNQVAYLIVNPGDGENSGDTDIYLNYIREIESTVFIPAFYFRENTEYIISSIENFGIRECMLICSNDVNADDPAFQALVERDEIGVINMAEPERNRNGKRLVQRTGKEFIRRDDLFEKEARNSNYLEIAEHRFSEEHIYYRQDGYSGFCDYTVLPSVFIEGGSTPRAVVIHLTYIHRNNAVWIRHFTSESSKNSIADIQGKFAEAAEKALNFCNQENLNNTAIQELRDYYARQHYPGLGTVKKISIKNHLLLLSQYLGRE